MAYPARGPSSHREDELDGTRSREACAIAGSERRRSAIQVAPQVSHPSPTMRTKLISRQSSTSAADGYE